MASRLVMITFSALLLTSLPTAVWTTLAYSGWDGSRLRGDLVESSNGSVPVAMRIPEAGVDARVVRTRIVGADA